MYNTVNERIKMLRKTLKLSQIEFANKIDSTQPSIYRWEKGEISPRKSALKKMCRIYGVSEKWLLEGIGDLKIEDKPIENKENSESIVILKDHSLLNYAGEKDKLSEVVYLNKDELLILEKFNFSNGFLIRVKDLFLFQCYTGLSYMDIWQGWEVLKKGNYFIKGSRGKNKKEYLIPLTDKSIDLLLKYNFRMPKYQNAPYNRAIKEVAMICGIDKNLSSHCARKTFATLQDAKGWSRESISKMLGHSSIKTTERYYLGNSADRIINEFESLAWA